MVRIDLLSTCGADSYADKTYFCCFIFSPTATLFFIKFPMRRERPSATIFLCYSLNCSMSLSYLIVDRFMLKLPVLREPIPGLRAWLRFDKWPYECHELFVSPSGLGARFTLGISAYACSTRILRYSLRRMAAPWLISSARSRSPYAPVCVD